MSGEEYFRGDQKKGITPPNLAKVCSLVDHIVHARGKKTAFTSVSLDRGCVERFGDTHYLLLQDIVASDGHDLIEYQQVLTQLQNVLATSDRADKAKAQQAVRYAKKNREGIVQWNFDHSAIAPSTLIAWAFQNVQKYFKAI